MWETHSRRSLRKVSLSIDRERRVPVESHFIIPLDFQKEQTDSKQRSQSASSTYNTFPDDLYLDDQDALEGSGRGGSDNRDDLEASGSGLGPDDEDGDDDHGTMNDYLYV